ncbi:MAG: PAS domain S-box protein [Desulfobulbaceae bacterium]|nr:PAS domain S-box protein [Desulfobulbaceae bacterium]
MTLKKSPTVLLAAYTLLVTLCWTLFVIGLAIWNFHGLRKNLLASAKTHAREVLNSDLVYQNRLAVQGGLYAPLSAKTQPNPWLSRLNNRDLTTTSGTKLTMVTPRYMSSHVHQLVFEQFGYKGHMTSLEPLRPENLPDEWEKKALAAFAGGAKEVIEFGDIDGKACLRLMRPVVTRKRCLTCHPRQENQVGKFMGGISLTVPLAPLLTAQLEQRHKLLINYLFIWLVGILGVGFGNLHLRHYLLRWERAEKALQDSEERFEMLFDQAPLSYQSLDENGCLIKVNQAWSENLGYKPDEVYGQSFSNLLTPGSKQKFAETFPEFKKRGQAHNVEFEIVRQNGEQRLISLSGRIGHDSRGNFRQTHCIFNDITEQRQAEKIVDTQRLWLATVINTLPDIICLKDGEGRWLLANNFGLQLFGLQEVDYQGKTDVQLAAHNLLYRESFLHCMETNEQAWNAKVTNRSIEIIPRPDGSEMIFDIIKIPIFNHDGSRNALVISGRDITAIKQAEDALRISEEALNRAQKVAQIGSWHLDVTNNNLIWSKQLYRIFDLKPGIPLTHELILANVHPEDLQKVDDAWQAALAGQPFEIEHRIIVNLQVKWVRNKVEIEFDPTGQAMGITGIFWDITVYKDATQQIKKEEEQWRRTFDSVDDIITILEPDLTIRKINQATINLFDRQETELIGKKCYELFRNGKKPCPGCPMPENITAGEYRSIEITHENLKMTFLVSAAPMYDDSGQITGIAHFARDVTEQKALSAQLLQSQKMEGIGRLAGGIAHDFNNILTVINGRAELALISMKNDNPLRGTLQGIMQAGERAASLTHQLLAFSRKQVIRPKSVNINSVVTNLGKMLRRLIGEDIELENQLEENLPRVLADPGQLEQIIINLVVNAADAIHSLSTTGIGKINISTALCNFDQGYVNQHDGSTIGPHIQLGVSDNGVGIPPEVKDNIFEPFFTTKEQGKGTGLGLATVYGIVKQDRGSVYMDSQPGVQTTFLVNWPVTRIQETQEDLGDKVNLIEGNGTIILAEDEEKLRELATESLQRAGYRVLAAADGNEAVNLAKNHNGRLNLLFTDLIMPGINGLETARQVTALRPDIKVLYTSGYISDRFELQEVDKNLLLDKPYTLPALTTKIKEVMTGKTSKES